MSSPLSVDSGFSSSTSSSDYFLENGTSDASPPLRSPKTNQCFASPSPDDCSCMPTSFMLPPGPDFSPPLRIRTHLYRSTAGPAPGELPLIGSFDDFLLTPGTVWVDKLPSVCSLCALAPEPNKLALVRRPSGLGQTAFITTAMSVYQFDTADVLRDLFPAMPAPQPASVVLELDMGWAFEHSICLDDMESRINRYMSCQLEPLLHQIGRSLHLSIRERDAYFESNSRKTFDNIIYLLRGAGSPKMIVLVKDLNWPLVHSTPDSAFHAAYLLNIYVVRPLQNALEHQCIAGGVLLAAPVADEPAWVHSQYKGDSLFASICCDITHDERVRGAFGFSLPEVTSLAEEFLEDLDARLLFLNEVKASQPAYRHGEYIEYSMKDVLSRLRQRTGQPDFEDGMYVLQDSDGQSSEDIEMEEVENHLLTDY